LGFGSLRISWYLLSNCIIGCPHVEERWMDSIDVLGPSMGAAIEIDISFSHTLITL